MSKAKLLFLVLAVGYVSIGVLSLIGVVEVSNIVLLGLSLSAFFTSLSDTLNQWIIYRSQKNHMSYIAKCSVKFVDNKLETGAQRVSNSISIRNVKKNIENQNPRFEKSIHPSIYAEKAHIKFLTILTYVFYVLSVIAFIIPPFIKVDFALLDKVSIFIALWAFGVMCFNIFLSELNADLSKKIFDFFNFTQPIVNSVYPDFMERLNSQLNYREDLKASKERFDKETAALQAESDAFIDNTVEEYSNGINH